MDEEQLKKNTDCVYFLASPLTCKKGNDCEFRHSESARVNPRDCRYWLGGNCLNWDCPFRHPPLEGRPTVAANAAPIPGVANKSRIPCYFFSQGFCAKGEKCTFMHGTPSLAPKSSAPQRPVRSGPASAIESNDKESVPAANGVAAKPNIEVTLETQAPAETRPAHVGGVQTSPRKEVRTYPGTGANQNGGARGRSEGPSSGHVGSGRLRIRQVQPGDDRVQNGMEQDEWWEESSPGFDVLVDDGPEQSRYPDDSEFQSVGEGGLETGKGGSRSRVRSMRMADDIEQYDYDYPHQYDHPYEGNASYEHGGYEYSVHEQQGGYDPSGAYEHMGQRGGYSDRGGPDEMLARERLGLPMEVDVRSGGGNNDHRSRLGSVKRRRPDGGPQHSSENHSRRQRTEMPMDEYQHHQRQQEDQQKQHELQLRQELFIQSGLRYNNHFSGRRQFEKNPVETAGVARRALQDIGAEVAISTTDRVQSKPGLKGRSVVDNSRSGLKESEHSRISKVSDSLGESEGRNYMDLEGNRKTEKEVRKDPSTFAGPKTLAQIKAEKRKGAVEGSSKKESLNGSKLPLQTSSASKGAAGRSQQQSPAIFVGDAMSGDASIEERKIRLDKVVPSEVKKLTAFEGPKSLSAILKEKRKVEPEGDAKPEETSRDHLQRISPSGSTMVAATGVDTGSAVESELREVDTGIGTDLDADVEDGELLSDDDGALKSRNDMNDEDRNTYSLDRGAVELQGTSSRDSQWQHDETANAMQTVEGGEDDIIEEPVHGSDYGDVQEDYEEEVRELDVDHDEDEEAFVGLDDEEEDDFAKKLGGFFS
ncbi:zinc finger CCCH domain-containing protein 11 [Marchantia polymorpha subsp. ruderalis]|uniref:C3H1-type domain-containing protein n=1 Tax=Marchantia polymorpha TaxID=3197 RepID=A0A2R6WM84_MARPO|nr:hypothetical protein MARPO_0075s0060 [Marchantia polymorpha]PTQ34956.1 hypothetical protein MARPO_0075s0060 [Marchantia polymorpha]BBN00901.1 hypothetical protein Mp_2g02990 [Marchantia polymorpha subsp. ruderalis]BBN00902.1 hypothetical protein Mp_2g02990 [Marchantia polymorpha subsp. ruderalis]|eukprot:PTQ34955.1 hypothetical protein MARPO_0075s0060 [Marchantia polymorpha]